MPAPAPPTSVEVSVVIPAYNQPRMLGETLASVHKQTAPPVEVVVIDDCSPQPLQPATPCPPGLPVRFVRHAANRGPAGSVAHGIREARCELIALLNHDDVWEPTFLERLAAALAAHPDAGLAFCDHGVMDADGRHDPRLSAAQSERYGRATLRPGPLAGAELQRAAILRKAVAGSSFVLARRAVLDLALIGAGSDTWDYALAVGACRGGRPAVYVGERLGWYRVSPTMLSATHANPRRQIELLRPHTAISLVTLRSPRLRPVHRAIRRRLLGSTGRALAVAARTGDPRNLARVGAAVAAGRADANALIAGHWDHEPPTS
ncbi:MAG TPA: glycosyltransferase family A protein [Solirubrobacteraceae bacterium]|jgi:hypothetical protein|nr:glycosyltransferase family A protein [Solirubrobacteraceae bacterium]